MNVYLTTLGCRLNEAELERWRRSFRAAGQHVVAEPDHANVIVVNTCAVTSTAGRKSRQLARRVHRSNPSAKLVLTGCYAQLEPEKVAAIEGVDLVVGNHEKDTLVDAVIERIDTWEMPELAVEPGATHIYAEGKTRHFIKVQDGCRNKCAFCVVTIARGEERSRSIEDIVGEIRRLENEGVKEVVLTGVHLGGYGRDLGTSLSALVQAVLDRTAVPRVRLSSLEPWDLPDDFFELWHNPRLCQHLHLPLQSGCDSVLRRMARRCMTDEYTTLVRRARGVLPDLVLTTDLIVGFPGETDEEFETTLDYIERIGFAHMHIFTYSARAGTRAARLPDQLPNRIKRARSRRAHALAATMKQARLERALGGVRPVLWEGRGDPLSSGLRRWGGYTDNYLRVETNAPAALDLENTITPTRLESIRDGEIIEGRVRLPARRPQRQSRPR